MIPKIIEREKSKSQSFREREPTTEQGRESNQYKRVILGSSNQCERQKETINIQKETINIQKVQATPAREGVWQKQEYQ